MTKKTNIPEVETFDESDYQISDGSARPSQTVIDAEDVCNRCTSINECVSLGYCILLDENPNLAGNLYPDKYSQNTD